MDYFFNDNYIGNYLQGGIDCFGEDDKGNSSKEDSDKIVQIETKRIAQFKNHPYKVLHDDEMKKLIGSIRKNGIMTPVMVRKKGDFLYELISGHRRLYAAERLGYVSIPAKVVDMDDNQATIAMVESNFQREKVLPSERAHALKMWRDAIRNQGKRNDLTCGLNVHKYGMKSTDAIGENYGVSGRQVRRYISLTNLNSVLLQLVDEKRIGFSMGVALSTLPENIQRYVEYYIEDGHKLKMEQVTLLKKQPDLEKLDEDAVFNLLKTRKETKPVKEPVAKEKTSEKADHRMLSITDDIAAYFAETSSEEEIRGVFRALLEEADRTGRLQKILSARSKK